VRESISVSTRRTKGDKAMSRRVMVVFELDGGDIVVVDSRELKRHKEQLLSSKEEVASPRRVDFTSMH